MHRVLANISGNYGHLHNDARDNLPIIIYMMQA